MRCSGIVREAGRGALGGEGYPVYEIRVVDVTTTVRSRIGDAEATVDSFEIMWWPADEADVALGQRPVAKVFTSEHDRSEFLAKMVRPQVALAASRETFERPHPLDELLGEVLIGVTFVSSYLQLDFQPQGTIPVPPHRGPLTCEDPPVLHMADQRLAYGDPGYADGLVSLIGTEISETDEYLDLGVFIGFKGDAALSLALVDADGPEVATFNTPAGLHVWVPIDPWNS